MENIYINSLLFSVAISFDSLVAFFGYGIENIKVKFSRILLIICLNTVLLACGLLFGYYLSFLISSEIIKYLSFSILILVGITKLIGDLIKIVLSKRKKLKDKTFLNVCIDPLNADLNKDKFLSIKESIFIGCALSIDSLGVGLGLGINNSFEYLILIFSFFIGLIFSCFGNFLGKKIASKIKLNLSWISGLLLILLAIFKII